MNKILHLFDEKYVIDYLTKKVLPLYPDFESILEVEIHGYKKNIWEKTYHVVIEFKTKFRCKDGEIVELPIFCSAHSDEPRENVYDSLKFLWDNGFGKGQLSIPHPLFFSKGFRGIFYRGVEGRNLYQFIREEKLDEVEKIVPKAAMWFSKLHAVPTGNAKNFNPENSRIKTVIPGVDHILERVSEKYPEYGEIYKNVYGYLVESEEDFLNSTEKRWLVHGDAHPENIIKMDEEKIGVIDFTDLCLSDFARDIGTFMQQLEFMCNRKISEDAYGEKIKNKFLEYYLKEANLVLDDDLKKRINNYYLWTSMRTATFYLLKSDAEPERAVPIIDKVKENF